jgi:hypothetical protein
MRTMIDLANSLNGANRFSGEISWKFHGPIACFTGAKIESLPMPCSPLKTSA